MYHIYQCSICNSPTFFDKDPMVSILPIGHCNLSLIHSYAEMIRLEVSYRERFIVTQDIYYLGGYLAD